MKKYIYSLCLLGAIVYSCKTQTTTQSQSADQTQSVQTSPPAKADVLTIRNGEGVFNARCGRCHGLPSPSEYTADKWKPIIATMAPKAKLTPEETSWVMAYVNENAKK